VNINYHYFVIKTLACAAGFAEDQAQTQFIFATAVVNGCWNYGKGSTDWKLAVEPVFITGNQGSTNQQQKNNRKNVPVRNPTSYMLTILYNAPEQYHLDIQNQVSHNMAN